MWPNDLLILILNYNSLKDSKDLLHYLLHEGIPSRQILLIDNHSDDAKALQELAEQHGAPVLLNPKNGGYAYGNNRGMEYGLQQGFNYFLLLNPDVRIDKRSIELLVQELQSCQTAGIVGPRICETHDPQIIFSDGGLLRDRRSFKTTHLHYGKRIHEVPTQERQTAIDYINGSALLCNKLLIERLGFMKESFFMYFEETHWCIKAKEAGIPLMVCTHALALHKQSKKQQLYYYYMLRNRLWLVREFNAKNFYAQCFAEGKRLLSAAKNWLFRHQTLPPYYGTQWKAIWSAIIHQPS